MTKETLVKSDRALAVPVRAVSVEALLADGGRMTGRIFLRTGEAARGQETAQDRLNDPERFFPFERGEPAGACLLQKGMVAAVGVPEATVAALATPERAHDGGEPHRVRVKLLGGETLNGRVWAQGPWHRARLVDYLNDLEGAFFPLETEGRTWYVNRDLVQSVVTLGTNGQAR